MHERYMRMALELAQKGDGRVNPNPMVGAVIVKNGEIIGRGYHEFFGGPHAEINAFNSASLDAEGSTMYVTLEPCCHFGKTPPCADEIIRRKVKKVVVGLLDPNPLVAGKGIERLRQHGIEVESGILEEECRKINEVFIKYITTGKPFVIMKSAMTLDGKIASRTGDSKWITGEEARMEVHRLRGKLASIMVGIGTVIADDPMLTCRIEGGTNPKRIIVDSTLRTPIDAKVLCGCDNILTIIAATQRADSEKIRQLEDMGIKVLILPEVSGRIDLQSLMSKLGELKIDSILLEGGAALNYSALEQNIVDKVMFYIAPKIIGGEMAKTPLGGSGLELVNNAFKVHNVTTKFVGEDILIEGYMR